MRPFPTIRMVQEKGSKAAAFVSPRTKNLPQKDAQGKVDKAKKLLNQDIYDEQITGALNEIDP